MQDMITPDGWRYRFAKKDLRLHVMDITHTQYFYTIEKVIEQFTRDKNEMKKLIMKNKQKKMTMMIQMIVVIQDQSVHL